MKKHYPITLILAILLLSSVSSNAQFLKKLKEKAEKELLKNIPSKEEKKDVPVIEEEKTEDTSTEEQADFSQIQAMMGLKKSDVAIKPTYTFDGEIIYEIKSNDDGDPVNYTYLYNKKSDYYGMKIDLGMEESGESFVIYEGSNVISFINTQGFKMYTVSENNEGNEGITMQSNFDDSKMEKTGRTKSIQGYNCEEYTYTEENTTVSAWTTDALDTPNPLISNQNTALNGHVLEYLVKNNESVFSVKVVSINKDKRFTLDTTGYQGGF